MADVPDIRIRTVNDAEINADGEFVLYWMIAFRRTNWNYSLQRAVEWARELKKPLVVFEPLRCGYPWANDRFHQFVLQGMIDNAERLAKRKVLYFPYVEEQIGDGKGLLAALANEACVVVSDDYPCFFIPRMIASAGRQVPVKMEVVDSNGILPMRAADKVFSRAFDFRRYLQKNLRPHFDDFPKRDPLANVNLPTLDAIPPRLLGDRRAAKLREILRGNDYLERFPIDHSVSPTLTEGGSGAAQRTLRSFLKSRLSRYETERNEPEQEATSGLSPYLHFGHISTHQVFSEVTSGDGWTPDQIAEKANGSAQGWWQASPVVESFLDELITWREVGFNMCWQRDDYDQYESLPAWAQKTLADHAGDHREHVYALEEFESSATHDPLWNAAQCQLVREGRIHNYLRMVWGKKILEWSPTPRDALEVLIELNNKYALDGRDPNSYSGIFWCLGRYDRAWGPERPIFGKIRYMSCANTARKVRVKGYIENYCHR